jgi:N,N'-diacetyllegionaminate synthase
MTYIIAEIGVNHNGNLELALQSIDAAKKSGADCAKFQTFFAKNLVTRSGPMASYQTNNLSSHDSQFNLIKTFELSSEDYQILFDYCQEVGIDFLSTATDEESAFLLRDLGVSAIKVGSGEVTNLPLLELLDSLGLPVYLSTGMSTLPEITEAVACFNLTSLTLLHCTSQYPAPLTDINLLAMPALARQFNVPVGYSDHSLGTDVALCAVALGAVMVEKHFTIDKTLPGPDHMMSMNPGEFADFVQKIRTAEVFLGDGIKRVMPSEIETRNVARRSLVSAHFIEAGAVIRADDLTLKRPGTGLPPRDLKSVIGRVSSHQIEEDVVLQETDFQ